MADPPLPALGVDGRAIVRRSDGRFLLLRRSSSVPTDAGLWEIPGGKMSYGESLQEALAREVLEETGVEIEVGPSIHICHFVKEPFWVTSVTFVCKHVAGDVRMSIEHDDFEWIAVSEIGGRKYARKIEDQLEAYATLKAA